MSSSAEAQAASSMSSSAEAQTAGVVVSPDMVKAPRRGVFSTVRLLSALLLLALALVPTLAHADALDDAVRRVALQLQCPVCEGETVADSPSGLAADMRAVIRTKLAAGESDQQILNEFVASYGDSILTEPPKHGISLGVWIGPLIGVAIGVLILAVLLKTWRRGASTSASSLQVDSDVADEFHRFRNEYGR
ncbi:MAG: cytochrome c-type biogenesis protein CcmH [Chloroflexi bacterium]|nr:cytochrome c-type biogenesis protein CcmH [Chloroflexota bacterium]